MALRKFSFTDAAGMPAEASASDVVVDRTPVTVPSTTTGTVTLDCATGNLFTLTPTGNVTLAFSNAPAAGIGQTVMLQFTQSATARTLSFPASVKFPGGAGFAVSTAPGAIDLLSFTTFDGGTTWLGAGAKAHA